QFWAEQARRIDWQTPFTQTLDHSNPPFARWFCEGRTNLCHNAIDRWLENDKGGNLMVLPLDQMLKGGNAPAAKSDNGASNLLRLPPASSSTTSGASNTSSTSQGDIMDQRRANAQRNDYQRQGE
uniref:acetyl-coenzyme A synthetase N-terminal domain-containing protein n=1 Tax=Escherichia coli TaxID=562 RepID=UPI0005CE9678